MARKVTLYIEDTEIKLVVTKGKQVEKWASLLLESGLVSDGIILDEAKVADSIKALFKLQGVKTKKVIVGLSGLNSIFRVISVPELPQAILPEAVMNEAGRVIPVPLDQVYLSYQPIPSPPRELRLFLVAYPRNSTDALITTLHKAGLKPYMMDLAPLALCRCANAPRAIIINAWLTYLDIVVMADRIPQVIRSLSLPTDAVSLKDKLPAIAEELNRTIAFYNSSYPEKPLDSSVPVFVCGDLAEAPDSWQSLVGKSGYPISALPSPLEFPELFSPHQFMVNMGLALKGHLPRGKDVHSSIVDFNALPEVYRPPSISLTRIFTPVAIVVGIGALAFGGFFIQDIRAQTDTLSAQKNLLYSQMDNLRSQFDSQITAVQAEMDNVRSQSDSQITTVQAEMDDVRSQMVPISNAIDEQTEAIAAMPEQAQPIEDDLESQLELNGIVNAKLASLEQGLDKTNKDLREAVNLLPTNVTLLGIDYGGDWATINGLALTEDDIFTYARALRSSGRFPTVVILSITETIRQEGDEEIRLFNFEFLIK